MKAAVLMVRGVPEKELALRVNSTALAWIHVVSTKSGLEVRREVGADQQAKVRCCGRMDYMDTATSDSRRIHQAPTIELGWLIGVMTSWGTFGQ